MQIEVQDTIWKRLRGAMFRDSLRDRILVFPYAHPARRLFHTFFWPQTRIIGLDGDGSVCFCQDVSRNRFVWLPEAQFVLVTDPAVPAQEVAATIQDHYPDPSVLILQQASFRLETYAKHVDDHDIEVPDHDEWSQVRARWVYSAGQELRSIERSMVQTKRSLRATLWNYDLPERAQKLASAMDIIDFIRKTNVLGTTADDIFTFAKTVVSVVHEHGDLYEVNAASIAGLPWPRRAICIKCQERGCIWSPVFYEENYSIAEDARWRYDRPENHVPVCSYCADNLSWSVKRWRRIKVARILWGDRFEAFLRWHEAATNNALPDSWDKVEYLLWPASYGGDTWESGSGARTHVDIYSPNYIPRTPAQREALADCLNMSLDELPQPLVSFPPTVAGFWKDGPDDA